MIRASMIVEKSSGRRVQYLFKDAGGKRWYSFDANRTWHTSKAVAYRQAKAHNLITYLTNENDHSVKLWLMKHNTRPAT
jgi:hypothetical protein